MPYALRMISFERVDNLPVKLVNPSAGPSIALYGAGLINPLMTNSGPPHLWRGASGSIFRFESAAQRLAFRGPFSAPCRGGLLLFARGHCPDGRCNCS